MLQASFLDPLQETSNYRNNIAIKWHSSSGTPQSANICRHPLGRPVGKALLGIIWSPAKASFHGISSTNVGEYQIRHDKTKHELMIIYSLPSTSALVQWYVPIAPAAPPVLMHLSWVLRHGQANIIGRLGCGVFPSGKQCLGAVVYYGVVEHWNRIWRSVGARMAQECSTSKTPAAFWYIFNNGRSCR